MLQNNKTRYWVAVACWDHVQRGLKDGIVQVCHGKQGPLQRMAAGDGILYYSPVKTFGSKDSVKRFTALGTITEKPPYQYRMTPDFVPWRREVIYQPIQEVEIIPLLARLSFIKNKQSWGFPFRRGCFEIPQEDFILIAQCMKAQRNEQGTF